LRDTLSQDFSPVLKKAILLCNSIPQKKLGFLAPVQFQKSGLSDPDIRRALALHHITRFKEPGYKMQMKRQAAALKSDETLLVGTLVMAAYSSSGFVKVTDAQVSFKTITCYICHLRAGNLNGSVTNICFVWLQKNQTD
jgi:hypothetical protein